MKKYILLYFLVFSVFYNVAAQINDLPKFKSYVWFEESDCEYNDINIIPRDRVRTNGDPYISYYKEDSILIREEYFKNGGLKSKAEITNTIDCDTMFVNDPGTGESGVVVLCRLFDIANGQYIEYSRGHVKNTGKCKNSRRIGEWTFFDPEGNKTIANFNQDGQFVGKYREYYFNPADSTYTVKIEGEYGLKQFETTYKTRVTGEQKKVNTSEVRRVGNWKYYAQDGTLLEIVSHKWIGRN